MNRTWKIVIRRKGWRRRKEEEPVAQLKEERTVRLVLWSFGLLASFYLSVYVLAKKWAALMFHIKHNNVGFEICFLEGQMEIKCQEDLSRT